MQSRRAQQHCFKRTALFVTFVVRFASLAGCPVTSTTALTLCEFKVNASAGAALLKLKNYFRETNEKYILRCAGRHLVVRFIMSRISRNNINTYLTLPTSSRGLYICDSKMLFYLPLVIAKIAPTIIRTADGAAAEQNKIC